MSFSVQFKEVSTLDQPDVIELLVALLEELFERAFTGTSPADLVGIEVGF